MKQIKPASIARIHTHECFTFLMDVLNFLQLIPEEGKTDKLLQAINQLDETFQAFDDELTCVCRGFDRTSGPGDKSSRPKSPVYHPRAKRCRAGEPRGAKRDLHHYRP